MPQLLVINPNTTQEITDKVANAISALAPAGLSMVARSGAFGPRYIASRATFAVAGHAALDAFANHGAEADAVLLACFGDPGLDALREVSSVPVIGLIEAAVAAALARGKNYSIVTGGELWRDMLRESLTQRGLTGSLASIKTVAPTGGQIAADPEGAIDVLAQACKSAAQEDGADTVILGGAGLVGLASRIEARANIPVICSVEAGAHAAFKAIATREANMRRVADAPAIDSIGLSRALSSLLEGSSPGKEPS
jgi:Asp/Glu/hydantoin racemase